MACETHTFLHLIHAIVVVVVMVVIIMMMVMIIIIQKKKDTIFPDYHAFLLATYFVG
jgi:type IV secretory pathway TrbL component